MSTIHLMTNLYTLLLLITTATAHDLLYFDEFEFSFNLLDSSDWDTHSLSHDYSTSLNKDPFQRRLITEYLSAHSDFNTDHASKCTNVIPVLFKQLCVQWTAHNGFSYHYTAPQPIAAHLYDTNWFYKDKNDKISSAQTADSLYSDLLDNDDVYLGDDSQWNEINYANDMHSFSLNNDETQTDTSDSDQYLKNFAKGSFKQCRHKKAMSECTKFDMPSKTLNVKVKTAKYSKHMPAGPMPDIVKEDMQGVDYGVGDMTGNDGSMGGGGPSARQIPANLFRIDANAMEMEGDYMDYDSDYDEGYYDYDSEYYGAYDSEEDYYSEDYDDYYGEDYGEYYDGDDLGENFEDVPAYDSEAEFEYGDARGYHNWAADMMRWDQFKCINCNEYGRRRQMNSAESDEFESLYEEYGDYTYLFHDHAFDFGNDNDWNEITKEGGMKCSIAIPGLSHKLCVDLTTADNDATISFAHADEDDIDYGYYDMYGYDMYYYNIDHLLDETNDGTGSHPNALSDAQLQQYDLDTDTDTDQDYDDDDEYEDDYGDEDTDANTDKDVDNNGGMRDSGEDYDDNQEINGGNTDNDNENNDNQDTGMEAEAEHEMDNGDNDSDNDNANDNDNGDADAGDDMKESQRDAYDNQGDGNAQQYPDRYKQWKEKQNDMQDQQQLAYLNRMQQPQQGYGNNMGGYGMVNPLQGLAQQMAYGRDQRRRLGAVDDNMFYENSNDVKEEQYFDEDYYETLIDQVQDQYDLMNEQFQSLLKDELSAVRLVFQNDELWDDITHINDDGHNKYIRKCAAFQILHLCAITDPSHKNLKLNLKIGKHKFHRSYRPWADAIEDMNDYYSDNDKKSMANMERMSSINSDDDSALETWGIDAGVIDVDDSQWNDDSQWSSSTEIPMSKNLKKKIIRKCKGLSFCLCQFMDRSVDNGQKHKCVSYRTHQRLQPKYKLLNVMDEFFSSPQMKKILKGGYRMKGARPMRMKGKNGMHIQFQYHPSIVHLHIMGKYPFFNKNHHLHKYKIPWFKYKKYAHLRPNGRPKWCPRWIWREVGGHLKRPKGFKIKKAARNKYNLKKRSKAQLDEFDYYNYDGDMVDRYAEMEDETDLDDRLPFVIAHVQAAEHLLPNVLNNAKKLLPKVLKKSVRKGGEIHDALEARGGPMHYGSGGYKLESQKKAFKGKGGSAMSKLFRSKKHNKLREMYLGGTKGKKRRRMRGMGEDYYEELYDELVEKVNGEEYDELMSELEDGYYDDYDEVYVDEEDINDELVSELYDEIYGDYDEDEYEYEDEDEDEGYYEDDEYYEDYDDYSDYDDYDYEGDGYYDDYDGDYEDYYGDYDDYYEDMNDNGWGNMQQSGQKVRQNGMSGMNAFNGGNGMNRNADQQFLMGDALDDTPNGLANAFEKIRANEIDSLHHYDYNRELGEKRIEMAGFGARRRMNNDYYDSEEQDYAGEEYDDMDDEYDDLYDELDEGYEEDYDDLYGDLVDELYNDLGEEYDDYEQDYDEQYEEMDDLYDEDYDELEDENYESYEQDYAGQDYEEYDSDYAQEEYDDMDDVYDEEYDQDYDYDDYDQDIDDYDNAYADYYGEDYDDLYDEYYNEVDEEEYYDDADFEEQAQDYEELSQLYDEIAQEDNYEDTFDDLIYQLYDDVIDDQTYDEEYDTYEDSDAAYNEYDNIIDELYSELGNYYDINAYEEYDTYNDEYDYDDEDYSEYYYDEQESEDIIDDWFDEETGMDWVISMDDITDDDMAQFNDAEKIIKNLITSSGNKIQRKCMNLFGKQVCICKFLEFIDAKPASNVCYPKTKTKPLKVGKKYKGPLSKKQSKVQYKMQKYNKKIAKNAKKLSKYMAQSRKKLEKLNRIPKSGMSPKRKERLKRLKKRIIARRKLRKIKKLIKKKSGKSVKAKLGKLKKKLERKRGRTARLRRIKARIARRKMKAQFLGKNKKRKTRVNRIINRIMIKKGSKLPSKYKKGKKAQIKKKLKVLDKKLGSFEQKKLAAIKKKQAKAAQKKRIIALKRMSTKRTKGSKKLSDFNKIKKRTKGKSSLTYFQKKLAGNKKKKAKAYQRKKIAAMKRSIIIGKGYNSKPKKVRGYGQKKLGAIRKKKAKASKKKKINALKRSIIRGKKVGLSPKTVLYQQRLENRKNGFKKAMEKKKLAVINRKIAKDKRVERKIKRQEKRVKKGGKYGKIKMKPISKIDLINGKPIGPATIKKIERANEIKKKKVAKKRLAKLKARSVLKQAQKNILKAKATKIRKDIKKQLPRVRPLWLPHYFWHWMHRAPHFHSLKHKFRKPWNPQVRRGKRGRSAHEGEQDIISGFAAALGNSAAHYLAEEVLDYEGYQDFEEDEYVQQNYDDFGENYDEDYQDFDSEYAYDGYQDFDEDYQDFDDEEYEDDYVQENYDEYEYESDSVQENYDDFDSEYEYDYDDSDNGYESEMGGQGWNDYEELDNGYGYEYEYDEEIDSDHNYLQNGNDFAAISGDSGEYSAGFMWLIGFVAFISFCVLAFFVSIGIRRRRRKLKIIERENIYMQQALEMTESESESDSDQENLIE